MDSVRKLDRAMLKCVITWKQMSFLMKIISTTITTMNISIDTIHTKFIHIKLTIGKASVYLRLCYEKYVEYSRR